MIVRPEDGALVLMTQEDHAHVSGELAARLVDAPAPRAAFVAAARMHDNGWREADASPMLNEDTKRPHSYRDIPDDAYVDIWRRGIARAVAADPYVGLLVSLHGMQFFQRSRSPLLRAFHDEERRREDHILRALGLDGTWSQPPEPARTHFEWIRCLDGVSLFLCGEWGDELRLGAGGREHHLRRLAPHEATMRPWPFGPDSVTFDLPTIRLPREAYDDADALASDVSKAPRESIRLLLRRE